MVRYLKSPFPKRDRDVLLMTLSGRLFQADGGTEAARLATAGEGGGACTVAV